MADVIVEETPNFDKKSFQNLLSLIPSYHQQEDTFFATLEPPTPAVSYDVDGELWIRYDPKTKEIVGFEIENFESIFLKKHPEISRLWKETKPFCVRRKTRSSDSDICDAFIRILVEFFTNFLNDNPQQLTFSPA